VESALLALFEPDKYFTSDKTESKLEEMIIIVPDGDPAVLNKAIANGSIVADATNYARDIINSQAT
jgi:leucyl aminopeptidase